MADRVSLSPNLLRVKISDTEIVSFSLMIGITPSDNRVESVVVALRYLDLYIFSTVSFSEIAGKKRKERGGGNSHQRYHSSSTRSGQSES